MVIFSTNKKNTEKMEKNCLHEDDVGKKCLRRRICLKKMFAEENLSYPPPEK